MPQTVAVRLLADVTAPSGEPWRAGTIVAVRPSVAAEWVREGKALLHSVIDATEAPLNALSADTTVSQPSVRRVR